VNNIGRVYCILTCVNEPWQCPILQAGTRLIVSSVLISCFYLGLVDFSPVMFKMYNLNSVAVDMYAFHIISFEFFSSRLLRALA